MGSNNIQEVDLAPPEEDNSLGMGRSYECVFCKRGFNTAQALGGHMNIHRKDRARNKPATSTNSSKHEEDYTVPRLSYQQMNPSHQPYYIAPHETTQFNYSRSCFPASGLAAQPFFANHHYSAQRFNPFGVDHWSMSFGLPCSSSAHVEDFEKARRIGGQEDELDLELRLGP
ncbi:uncharacterized protein [Coffea arabica]|uniref:C2H2-type domain-containing protein n=1 Tax=Coffea arabica TaxID=13443 RepID=A0A6P6XHC4_COFAR|nr:zinc finger protein 8-like [Coffea arabica]